MELNSFSSKLCFSSFSCIPQPLPSTAVQLCEITMGNRVKGRPKRSSIKAALSSAAGSKRKLSRMGKKQKREHAGLEASFIGRSQCIKMLQVTIKDFRRLCILKGIYPREPLGRVPGKKKGQTFYHIKDIRAIAHEPVLEKFRDIRSFMKKVG